MTTALSIIDDAYLITGLRGEGEPLTAERAQFALSRLNAMLDSWATDNLFLKQRVEYVTTVAAGPSFTIGPGGDINIPFVPVRLEDGCFTRNNSVDFPLTLINSDQYDEIAYKFAAAPWGSFMYYSPGIDLGECFVYPAMSAPAEIHLQALLPLTSFPDLTTDVSVPVGYGDAFLYSLCEILCMGKMQVPAEIAKAAARARKRIREANVEVPVMDINVPYGNRGSYGYGWRFP